ncbi:Protein of unknown function [Pyronema omphalodes CBS 100304]|uniref:Uncharacterized protein n=1 Tax=Pyronema omphalodes (strain CBS 100304) TaxID=1076935 RepID=U4KYD9_PYROM|nr:Protein of unknown function [Pyronema omphalodes CBS 100304]
MGAGFTTILFFLRTTILCILKATKITPLIISPYYFTTSCFTTASASFVDCFNIPLAMAHMRDNRLICCRFSSSYSAPVLLGTIVLHRPQLLQHICSIIAFTSLRRICTVLWYHRLICGVFECFSNRLSCFWHHHPQQVALILLPHLFTLKKHVPLRAALPAMLLASLIHGKHSEWYQCSKPSVHDGSPDGTGPIL